MEEDESKKKEAVNQSPNNAGSATPVFPSDTDNIHEQEAEPFMEHPSTIEGKIELVDQSNNDAVPTVAGEMDFFDEFGTAVEERQHQQQPQQSQTTNNNMGEGVTTTLGVSDAMATLNAEGQGSSASLSTTATAAITEPNSTNEDLRVIERQEKVDNQSPNNAVSATPDFSSDTDNIHGREAETFTEYPPPIELVDQSNAVQTIASSSSRTSGEMDFFDEFGTSVEETRHQRQPKQSQTTNNNMGKGAIESTTLGASDAMETLNAGGQGSSASLSTTATAAITEPNSTNEDLQMRERQEKQQFQGQHRQQQHQQQPVIPQQKQQEQQLQQESSAPASSTLSPHIQQSNNDIAADLFEWNSNNDASSSTTGIRRKGGGTNMMKRRLPPSGSTVVPEMDENDVGYSSSSDIESQPQPKKSSHNWKILLRNALAAVFTEFADDETLRRPNTETSVIIITLLKESMLAIIITFAIISFSLFLDHRLLLHLPTARTFRKASFQLMNDKETLQTLQENANMVFMPMEEYDSISQEIASLPERDKLADKIIKKRNEGLREMAEKKKELGDIDKLFERLGLHLFCEQCLWSVSPKISCSGRAKALEEIYKTPKFQAMMSAMGGGHCTKDKKMLEEEQKKKKEVEEMLKVWDAKKKDFCRECKWDSDMTCMQRVHFLNFQYSTSMDEAMASLMIGSVNCLMSTREEEEKKLRRFCASCMWGNKMTCQQRAEYLKYTYKNPERVAILAAMVKPSCMKPEGQGTLLGMSPAEGKGVV